MTESSIHCGRCGRDFVPEVGTGRVSRIGTAEFIEFEQAFCPHCGRESRRRQRDPRRPDVELVWEGPD